MCSSPGRDEVLARLRPAPRVLSLSEGLSLVERWSRTLELPWGRTEVGQELHERASRESAAIRPERTLSLTALLEGPLRFVASDFFGRRVVLAEATPVDETRWSFQLGPEPEALLESLLECGTWPLWLALEQVRLVPLGDEAEAWCEELAAKLVTDGWRVRVHGSDRSPLASRIHAAAQTRVPLLCVVGRRELQANTLTLRWRNRPSSTIPSSDLAAHLTQVAAWDQAPTTHPAESTSAPASPDVGGAAL